MNDGRGKLIAHKKLLPRPNEIGPTKGACVVMDRITQCAFMACKKWHHFKHRISNYLVQAFKINYYMALGLFRKLLPAFGPCFRANPLKPIPRPIQKPSAKTTLLLIIMGPKR